MSFADSFKCPHCGNWVEQKQDTLWPGAEKR